MIHLVRAFERYCVYVGGYPKGSYCENCLMAEVYGEGASISVRHWRRLPVGTVKVLSGRAFHLREKFDKLTTTYNMRGDWQPLLTDLIDDIKTGGIS